MKSKEALAALRVEAEALAQRKRVLEETCRTEHAKHGEAHGRLRRRQMQGAQKGRKVSKHACRRDTSCLAIII